MSKLTCTYCNKVRKKNTMCDCYARLLFSEDLLLYKVTYNDDSCSYVAAHTIQQVYNELMLFNSVVKIEFISDFVDINIS